MFSKFESWLRSDIGFFKCSILVIFGAIINLLWAIFIVIVMTPPLEPGPSSFHELPFFGMIFEIICLAWIEEVLFRFPLILIFCIAEFFLRQNESMKITLLSAVLISILFGMCHGFGFFYVVCQGMGGLVLSIVFLKCGGTNFKLWKALICATLTHALYNFFISCIGG